MSSLKRACYHRAPGRRKGPRCACRARTLTRGFLALAAGLAAAGCYDFHLDGPRGSAPAAAAAQRHGDGRVPSAQRMCNAASDHCGATVVFFGSWMRPRRGARAESSDAAGHLRLARARPDVPVNFPPRAGPTTCGSTTPTWCGPPTGGFTRPAAARGRPDLTRVRVHGPPATSVRSSTSTTTGRATTRSESARSAARLAAGSSAAVPGSPGS